MKTSKEVKETAENGELGVNALELFILQILLEVYSNNSVNRNKLKMMSNS